MHLKGIVFFLNVLKTNINIKNRIEHFIDNKLITNYLNLQNLKELVKLLHYLLKFMVKH